MELTNCYPLFHNLPKIKEFFSSSVLSYSTRWSPTPHPIHQLSLRIFISKAYPKSESDRDSSLPEIYPCFALRKKSVSQQCLQGRTDSFLNNRSVSYFWFLLLLPSASLVLAPTTLAFFILCKSLSASFTIDLGLLLPQSGIFFLLTVIWLVLSLH